MTSRLSKIKAQKCIKCSNFMTRGKLRALLVKNFLMLLRNVGLVLFIFGTPIIQTVLFCLAIGHDPSGLELAVVNKEINGSRECGYDDNLLSCRYLSYLDNYQLQYFDDHEKALEEAKSGKFWGVLLFNKNFSKALFTRIIEPQSLNESLMESSEIIINLDMSNSQIGYFNTRELLEAYKKFIAKYLEDNNSNSKLGEVPINFEQPIYGKNDPNFSDFVAPGVVLT